MFGHQPFLGEVFVHMRDVAADLVAERVESAFARCLKQSFQLMFDSLLSCGPERAGQYASSLPLSSAVASDEE